MILVLDSSVLCSDLRLNGAAAQALLGNTAAVPVTVVIPGVVLDEVTAHFAESLQKARTDFDRAHQALSRLVAGIADPEIRPRLETEKESYRQYLLERLSAAGGKTVPYPKVEHEIIVGRALDRRKPFKRNGSGYRDLLVWESVRRLGVSGHEVIAFATANTKDFAEDSCLHRDLAQDILNPERVELFTSIRQFNDKHVLPKLEVVEQFHRSLAPVAGGEPGVAGWIHRHFLEALENEELGHILAPLPPGVGTFQASEIVSFDHIETLDARRSGTQEILAKVKVTASVAIHINIDEHDYRSHLEVGEWLDASELGSWHEVFALDVLMDLILDASAASVKDCEITDIEPHQVFV